LFSKIRFLAFSNFTHWDPHLLKEHFEIYEAFVAATVFLNPKTAGPDPPCPPFAN